ncbi:hypothetical protein L5D93_01760 [Paenibacillus thiaminolyticus]|nr:hypothetical protein [Paenibacillus thiaminolyticus]
MTETYPEELRSAKGGRKGDKAAEPEEVKAVWNIAGDPTEGALLVLAAKLGMTPRALQGMYERTQEYPFDSERKRMSVVVTHQGGDAMF